MSDLDGRFGEMLKYAVIGLGRFGGTLARELSGQGAEVIAIDTDEEALVKVRDHVSVALRMDGTDERALREQGVDGVDIAVVGMAQRFEATQLATVVLRRMGVRRVIVKSATPLQDKILRRLGADEVISPEKESAVRLAQKLISPASSTTSSSRRATLSFSSPRRRSSTGRRSRRSTFAAPTR